MSNSNLACYAKISPNRTSPRNHAIDTITIHCMAGNLSVETCGNVFAPTSYQASSNYGIGSDGRIAMYVEEKDRAWTSSNAANDHRAVTIEVANDGGAETGWHVSDKAMASLVELCADICRQNGINGLRWQGDKSLIGQTDKQNMTVHRWFAATACPGDYLYGKMGWIANEVNKKIGITSASGTASTPNQNVTAGGKKSNEEIAKEVIAGKWGNGTDRTSRLQAAGYDANAVQGIVNKMLAGTYTASAAAPAKKSNEQIAQEVINGAWGNGEDRKSRLRAAGYDPDAIQAIVNGKLSGASSKGKKTVETIAKEVIAGKWGNGQDRINRLYAAGYNPAAVQKAVNRLCG